MQDVFDGICSYKSVLSFGYALLRSHDRIDPYSVDAKLATGKNPVVVYPKTDLVNAPFHPGDRFEHKDAPMSVKVLKKNEDGSYFMEVQVKSLPPGKIDDK